MIRRARRRARRRRNVAVIAGTLALGVIAATLGWTLLSGGDGRDASPDLSAAPTTTTTAPTPFARYWFTGDSVASNLAPPLAELATARGLAWVNATSVGCRVLEGRATLPDGTVAGPTNCESLVQRVAAKEPGDAQVAVILSSGEISGLQQGDGAIPFATPAWEAATFDLWARALDALKKSGIRSVVIVAPAPPADWIAELSADGLNYSEDVRRYERFLSRVAARHAELVTIVRLSSVVCPGGPCPRVVAGVELRPGEGGHLPEAGAATVAPELLDRVVAAANRLA